MESGIELIRRIREEAIRYLADETTLSEFIAWFAETSQACIDTTPPAAEETVAEVRLVLAEFGRGDRSEDELRDELRLILKSAIDGHWHRAEDLAIATHTGSSSSVVSGKPSLNATLIRL
jgi:hypothetical protein